MLLIMVFCPLVRLHICESWSSPLLENNVDLTNFFSSLRRKNYLTVDQEGEDDSANYLEVFRLDRIDFLRRYLTID